jgi:hypothetical protein
VDVSIVNTNCAEPIILESAPGTCINVPIILDVPHEYFAIVKPLAFDCLPCGGEFNDYTVKLTCLTGCPGDPTSDGAVDVDDLLLVINSWGDCQDCVADLTGDDEVDTDDLLMVINHWGPCNG